jgi:protein-tyrosine phosphatase
MMKQVLFICSANYYRSRFAEHLFNWLAEATGLPWRADSRGLTPGSDRNVGPISRYAIEGLKVRGIALDGSFRFPQQVSDADFARADLVIALKEAEHRAAITQWFPKWADQVEFWHIDDLDCSEAEEALAKLDQQVRVLVMRLAKQK